MATLQILVDGKFQLGEMLHVTHIGITQNQTGSNISSIMSLDGQKVSTLEKASPHLWPARYTS